MFLVSAKPPIIALRLPISLLINVSNYSIHGYRRNTNKWKIDSGQRILATKAKTGSTILSCLSIFQTLKGKRLGRNQRTRRRSRRKLKTHAYRKKKGKKIFCIYVINWSCYASDARREAIAIQEVFCLCLPLATNIEKKRTQEQHLIKHTRVYETLFSRRLCALDVRLPPMLIVTVRPSFFYQHPLWKTVSIIENIEGKGGKLKYIYTWSGREHKRKDKFTFTFLSFFSVIMNLF
jgi:hypothetical protein